MARTTVNEVLPNQEHAPLPANIRHLKSAVLSVVYALLAYYIAYVFWTTPLPLLSAANFLICAVFCLPLAAFIPGLRKNRIRSHAWLSFFILIYFMHGVVIAFDPAYRIIGIVESTLTMSLFVLLMLFIRYYRNFAQVSLFTNQ